MSDVAISLVEARKPPPAPARPWTGLRITGHVLLALWIVAGIYLAIYLFQNIYSPFFDRYFAKYVEGIWVTLKLVVLSILIGAAISVPVAIARGSSIWLIAKIAFIFVYFFRGTPLIAQTFLFYYGSGVFRAELTDLGLWWIFRDAFYCVLFTFSLNTSAYQAEILRGAVKNISKGQWEGGLSLGLSRPVIFFKIILPQALMVALRPYGNEIILMLKGSAIASIVTVYDVMGETRRAYSRSYDFQAYIWAAVIYLFVVEALRRVWDRLEARLTRHLKR